MRSAGSTPLRLAVQLLGPLLFCASALTAACLPSPTQLCLQGDRFQVEVDWQDRSGRSGPGKAVALSGDTGYFTFFNPENVELVVKTLDGRGTNGYFWVFYGALSNVRYTLTVTDTETGISKTYDNPQGRLASASDPRAFGPFKAQGDAAFAAAPSAVTALAEPLPETARCTPAATELCLSNGRFRVRVTWRRPDGTIGQGRAVPLTRDTGYFWFFRPSNVELVVKTIDGRAFNGDFWVFSGSLTDVEYVLEVTDTETGSVRVYRNPAKTQASLADTRAFDEAPDPAAVAGSLRGFADRLAATSREGLVRQSPELALLAQGTVRVLQEKLECLAKAAELGTWACNVLDPESGETFGQIATAADAAWLAAYLTLDPTFDQTAGESVSAAGAEPGAPSPTSSSRSTSAGVFAGAKLAGPATAFPGLPECGWSDRKTAVVYGLCASAASPPSVVTAADWAASAICAAAFPRLPIACGAYALVSLGVGILRASYCNYSPIELNEVFIEPRPKVELPFDDSRELVVRGIFRSHPRASNLVTLTTSLAHQTLRRLGVPDSLAETLATSVGSSWLQEAFGDRVPAPGPIVRCEGTLSQRYAAVRIEERTGGPVTLDGRTLRSGSSEADGTLAPVLTESSPWRPPANHRHSTPFAVRPTECTGSGRYRLETYSLPRGPLPPLPGTTDTYWVLCDGSSTWFDTHHEELSSGRFVVPGSMRGLSRCDGRWREFRSVFSSSDCFGSFTQDCSLASDVEVSFTGGVLSQRVRSHGSAIDPSWPAPVEGPLRLSQDTETSYRLDLTTRLLSSRYEGTYFYEDLTLNCRVASVFLVLDYAYTGPVQDLGYACRYVQSCP